MAASAAIKPDPMDTEEYREVPPEEAMDVEAKEEVPPGAPLSLEDPDHKTRKFRQYVYSAYCLTRSAFATVEDYNHYLDERQNLLFELLRPGGDIKKTKEKIEKYKRENADLIESTKLREATLSKQEKQANMCAYLTEELARSQRQTDKRKDAIEGMARNRLTAVEFAKLGKELDHEDWSAEMMRQQQGIVTKQEIKKEVPKFNISANRAAITFTENTMPKPLENPPPRPDEKNPEIRAKMARAGGHNPAIFRARAIHEAFGCLTL